MGLVATEKEKAMGSLLTTLAALLQSRGVVEINYLEGNTMEVNYRGCLIKIEVK